MREPSERDILQTSMPLVDEKRMPDLKVEGVGTFEIEEGKRLVLAP